MKYVLLLPLLFLFSCEKKVQCSFDDLTKACAEHCGESGWRDVFISNSSIFGTSIICSCKVKDFDMK
jgi:hypothetical protein